MEDIEMANESFEILVNNFTVESARQFRIDLLTESRKDPKKPLVVWIDSYGGMVDAMATMVETMESVPNEIITACIGKAQSCGAILLSFGDRRYCGKHSRIMIHEVSFHPERANINEVVVNTNESMRLNRYWLHKLAENCRIKGGFSALKKILKNCEDERTLYLDAKQALKFGVVDFIGLPKMQSTFKVENV